ncbi:hypothetical protein E7744_01050 [Citricoccus sp. SGAir0253]|uniref:hypothetical protein n=1 Tax=Citricoccus sp. SGAir0253 TaxID=2567881 RepID=UPI0010CD0901|nr:hypothetical protein [Citricoccus sp. SGAir0253]QCU76969.1 hypothetical protein E7744_01050 [Citricoccus sp. SGAir0253]
MTVPPWDDPPETALEAEWSTRFREALGRLGRVSRTGIAEIKPHKDDQIRKGLYQLREYLFRMRVPTPRRVGSAWLLTYRPLSPPGGPRSGGTVLQVVAHRIDRGRLLPPHVTTRRALAAAGPPPGLAALTEYRAVLPALRLPRSLPSSMPFPTPARPDAFGLAVEDPIRALFRRSLGIATLRAPASRADVQWETARFYDELTAATGDPYWRELAGELSGGLVGGSASGPASAPARGPAGGPTPEP